jgi:O-Antigen ligase
MSTQPALHLSSAALSGHERAPSAKAASVAGLTLNGWILFLMSLLVVASGFSALRPRILGLALHPYLVPMAAALPLVVLARIGLFPVKVLAALVVFNVMYCFSALSGGGAPLGEIFKVGSGFLTIITCALLVRKRGDFVAGALGLSIAIMVLALRGLQEDVGSGGVQVMQDANKNTYSLFALPAILMAGFIVSRMKSTSVTVKGLFIGCTMPALAAIFLSANRSGYLGAVLIGFLLFWDRRGKGMLIVGAVAGAIILWMANYADTTVFDERMRQTVEGTQSDDLRVAIAQTCVWIALENPVIGVSPEQLPFEIGQRTNVGHSFHINYLNAHNVFAHVAAASGLICFAALLAVGFTMWTLERANGKGFGSKEDPARQARSLMRMMVTLWAVRGMFTHEILYNPACNIALGLCVGLFIMSQTMPSGDDAAKENPSRSQLPRNGPPAVPVA